jgi:septum formation protein
MQLYLASTSPRRQELLRQVGFEFTVLAVDVPEVQLPNELPAAYSQRVAQEKATAGFAALGQPEGVVVLGADTEVVLDDEVFGKPQNAAHAAQMLQKLSGKTHATLTSVCAISASQQQVLLQTSKVRFKSLSAQEIDHYVASGESVGRAGAYAIQGLAASFISHLEGSYSGVMGLPVFETTNLLASFGVLPKQLG